MRETKKTGIHQIFPIVGGGRTKNKNFTKEFKKFERERKKKDEKRRKVTIYTIKNLGKLWAWARVVGGGRGLGLINYLNKCRNLKKVNEFLLSLYN